MCRVSRLNPLLVFIILFQRTSDLVDGNENIFANSLYAWGLFRYNVNAIFLSVSVYLFPLLFLLARRICELKKDSFCPWKYFESCWMMFSEERFTFSRSSFAFSSCFLLLNSWTLSRLILFFIRCIDVTFILSVMWVGTKEHVWLEVDPEGVDAKISWGWLPWGLSCRWVSESGFSEMRFFRHWLHSNDEWFNKPSWASSKSWDGFRRHLVMSRLWFFRGSEQASDFITIIWVRCDAK